MVFSINPSPKNTILLRWYVKFHDLRNNNHHLLSRSQAVESMLACFVDDVIIPEMEKEKVNITAFLKENGV